MLHVPYRGEGTPHSFDLLGGQVQLMIPQSSRRAIEYIRTGRMRAMAVTTHNAICSVPDVPTVSEFVPGYEGRDGWSESAHPRNTPVAMSRYSQQRNKQVPRGPRHENAK